MSPRIGAAAGRSKLSTAAPTPATPATPRQLLAWAFFDWASSPFFAVVITFVFATYFTSGGAGRDRGHGGLEPHDRAGGAADRRHQPVLGAIADAGGRRKPWLLVFML